MAPPEIATTKKDTGTTTDRILSGREARIARRDARVTFTSYARINTLNQIMPQAGLRYHDANHIGIKLTTDHLITTAIFKVYGKSIATAEVDELMAGIFDTANNLIRTLAVIADSDKPVIGPITFINKVWQRILTLDATKWVRGMTIRAFSHFFMIVRAARLRWLKGPRMLYGQDQVSLLAKSIDHFEAAAEGKIQWVGAEMVKWLRGKKQTRGGLERQIDVLLGGKEPSVEMDVEKDKGGSEGDDIMKDICSQLEDFCLEVPDSQVLAEALEKLSL